jgi:NADP-dependent 3-hydroxy acid dehydrogenase YdfG
VSVVIAARREEVLRRTADEINAKMNAGRVIPYAFDIRQHQQIEALVQYVNSRFNCIDLLINNSGLAVPETIDQITDM